MTIASEITRINNNIAAAYTALADKGATIPATQNSANLADCVESIPVAYNNFFVNGQPDVNITTGVVSGFSSSKYLKLPQVFDPAGKTWEIGAKFTTASDTTTAQVVFQSCKSVGSSSGRYGIVLEISDGSSSGLLNLSIGTSSSWLFSEGCPQPILANTTYWVKIGWTGTVYYLDYSTDGETYTRGVSYSSTTACYTPLVASFIGAYSYNSMMYPMKGTIDLSAWYMKIDGETVWTAVGLAGYPQSNNS